MPVSAELTIHFTANYVGNHLVCYRIQGSGDPYTCTTVSCLGLGNPCQATFTITVDNETCDSVIYEGYVSADCEPSVLVPFPDFTFVPTPECNRYVITCETVSLAGLTIVNPGAGYDPGNAPSTANGGITLSGGGGTGFVATAIVNANPPYEITGFTITNNGSGFVTLPGVTIGPSPGYNGETPVDAEVTAILGYCPEFLATDCDGFSAVSIPGATFQPTETFDLCYNSTTPPTVPATYSAVADGNCLCECTYLRLEVTGSGTITYYYNNCNGDFISGTMTAGDPILQVCIVDQTFFYNVTGGAPTVSATYTACP